MNKYRKRNQLVGMATVALAFFPLNALAQDAITFLNEANTQVRSAGSIIYQLVIAVLAIIAIVSLITVGIKMYSGDQESANKALGWTGGMVFVIIAALVLKNFIGL